MMKYLIFSCFMVLSMLVSGQQSDSIIKVVPTVKFVDEDLTKELEKQYFDTSLTDFYQYEYDGRRNFVSLGNPGLSYSSFILPPLEYGFNSGEESFDLNFQETSGNRIYHTKIPFARVSYRSGPKKYQDFDVFYTQNYSEGFNVAVSYNTQSSTGFYINQETVTKRFSFENSFNTKKDTYGYLLKFKVNSGSAEENGGIKSDSLYNELIKLSPFDTENNKLKVQVWLEDDFNRYDHRELLFNQYVRLWSRKVDSVGKRSVILGYNLKGNIDDVWFSGENSDSNYYERFGITISDSSVVRDKSHLFSIRNNGFVKYVSGKNNTALKGGVNLNYFDFDGYSYSQKIEEANLFVEIDNLIFGKFNFNVETIKGLSGFNSEGLLGSVGLVYNKDGRLWGKLKGAYLKNLPEYKMLNYSGNVLGWNNDFDYSSSNRINGLVKDNKTKLSLLGFHERIGNYVYYGLDGSPHQYDNTFNRYQIQLKKEFVLASYHFDISVIYNNVDDAAPVNVPSWVGLVSFYYQRFLFKNAMELRYGIDYWQNSSYAQNVYLPFTRSFAYQNEVKVGDYPYLNFYISARIKGAQGFVNFQNIGQFFFRENYMMVPDYALQDFGISFGLRWDFYN